MWFGYAHAASVKCSYSMLGLGTFEWLAGKSPLSFTWSVTVLSLLRNKCFIVQLWHASNARCILLVVKGARIGCLDWPSGIYLSLWSCTSSWRPKLGKLQCWWTAWSCKWFMLAEESLALLMVVAVTAWFQVSWLCPVGWEPDFLQVTPGQRIV